MIKLVMVICFSCVSAFSAGQEMSVRLKNAFTRFTADSQMKYGIAALQVVDLQTGKVVFGANSGIGLAAASTQKIVTSASAFALLGSDFRYITEFGYAGPVHNGILQGNLVVRGSGDPTLGSSRYQGTAPAIISAMIRKNLASHGIQQVEGHILAAAVPDETQTIPDGWIWEDIGNYYGAGVAVLNWNENAYDLWLKPGRTEGDPVSVIRTRPSVAFRFEPELLTGKKGSGDQAWLYFNPNRPGITIRGTIPCCVDSFRISGAIPDPVEFTLMQIGALTGIHYSPDLKPDFPSNEMKWIYRHHSPSLDSISYWFLNKSINLYGEALIRSIGQAVRKKATTMDGLEAVLDFWHKQGIDKNSLRICDGSGLSPSNRITAASLTGVLQFAYRQSWFSSYMNGFPLVNGMRMKSGTIDGVRAYTGYVNRSGRSYAFAIIANNYSGPTSTITRKMWSVLEEIRR